MSTDIWEISRAILLTTGAAGAIIFGLASWLGKVWASRILASEKAALKLDNETKLNQLISDLEIYKQKHLKGHDDKIAIYRHVVNTVTQTLADANRFIENSVNANGMIATPNKPLSSISDEYTRGHFLAYGYLAMLAPQNVMDAYDELTDHIYFILNGTLPYEWPVIREHIIKLLNEVRKDIGIDVTPIKYRGKL